LAKGAIDVVELRFIPADPIYERLSVDVDGGQYEEIYMNELAKNSVNFTPEFKYYYLENSYTADECAERGIMLNDETLDTYIKRIIKNMLNINIMKRNAYLKTDKLTLTAKDGASYIVANGRYLFTSTPIYMKNGRMYAPILLMAKAFDAKASWSDATSSFNITRGSGGILSGDKYYREDEVYWLSKIINAEAGGEIMIGKIAVGNVVLNRTRSSAFPNTIYGVIFDTKNGVQFSPVANGTIYKSPNSDSIIAAKICLEGYTISYDILYFVNPKVAPNSWASKNRPYFDTIGNHVFYK
jgi:N-acetylmuramoyl-L-alanine amidase